MFWLGITPINSLGFLLILPNEAVLAAKKYLCDQEPLLILRLIAFFVVFKYNFYFFSLIFVLPLSCGRYWEARYKEENKDEGIFILHFILLLFIPFFL